MIDEKTLMALSACPLFKGMQSIEVARQVERAPMVTRNLERGQLLASAGDACMHADIVIQGTLTARMMSASGKLVQVTRLQPGNLIAPAFIFAHDNTFPVEVAADTSVKLLRLSRESFRQWLNSDEHLLWNFVTLLSNTNAFLTRKLHTLSLLTVREKIGAMLLQLMRQQESRTVTLDKSRQEIADMFGIQKFSVTRQLAEFQDEGAITINGKQVTINNAQQLMH